VIWERMDLRSKVGYDSRQGHCGGESGLVGGTEGQQIHGTGLGLRTSDGTPTDPFGPEDPLMGG